MGHFRFCERLERVTVNYANVADNVAKAALTRVFIDCPPWNPTRSLNRVARTAAARMARQVGPEYGPSEMDECLKRFPPVKRELYSKALKSPFTASMARVTAFIKEENVPYKPADKPRLIQFRDPGFLAHLLSALKPVEHAFYHGRYLFNRYQKHTCAKGMNSLVRMKTLEGMVSDLEKPFVVDLDGSAFDAHVVKEALKVEWRFYTDVMTKAGYGKGTINKMDRMGRLQQRNKVFCRCDDGIVKYVVEGNRMSGDLNTGLGNSVLQSIFIATAMADLHIPERHWRMLVDGDDAVLMVSEKYVPNLAGLVASFASFSQEVKMGTPMEVTLKTMEVIDFCQSRPVWVAPYGWRLLRNPYKVYNGYKMVNIWYRSLEEAQRFWATVAPAEQIYSRGVPIHQDLFALFHRLSGSAQPLDIVARRFWIRNCWSVANSIPDDTSVSWETRDSYARAFGISVADQLSIEDELQSWSLSHLPPHWQPL